MLFREGVLRYPKPPAKRWLATLIKQDPGRAMCVTQSGGPNLIIGRGAQSAITPRMFNIFLSPQPYLHGGGGRLAAVSLRPAAPDLMSN